MRAMLFLIVFSISGCVHQPLQVANSNDFAEKLPASWEWAKEVNSEEKRSLVDVLSSPEIISWIDQVLMQSYDLKQADLEQTQQLLLIEQAKSYQKPELNLNVSGNRAMSREFGKQYQNRFQLGAQVSWELDLWGKISKQGDAAKLDYELTKIQKDAIRRSLVGQALKAQITWSALKEQYEFSDKNTRLLSSLLNRSKDQIYAGEISFSELDQMQVNYDQSLAQLSQEKQDIAESDILRKKLVGVFGSVSKFPKELIKLGLPSSQVTAKHLLNRPDVSMAMIQVKRADVASVIAHRSLYPSFSLNLDVSQSAIDRQNLLGADPVWTLLGQLTQPIFNGGRLKAQVTLAELDAKKALLKYQETLEEAYLEVDSLLSQEYYLAQHLKARASVVVSMHRKLASFETQFRDGLIGLDEYLEVIMSLNNAKRELLATELEQVTNRIDLFLALGLPLS